MPGDTTYGVPPGQPCSVAGRGFILIFALIVILFSLYQSQIVPPENAQTEYQHSQTVQGDMLELRNALLTADTTGETQFVDIKLGTHYQPRTFALNPPAATGTLRTSEPHPIVIRNETGSTVSNVCPAGTSTDTRILSYTPRITNTITHPASSTRTPSSTSSSTTAPSH